MNEINDINGQALANAVHWMVDAMDSRLPIRRETWWSRFRRLTRRIRACFAAWGDRYMEDD